MAVDRVTIDNEGNVTKLIVIVQHSQEVSLYIAKELITSHSHTTAHHTAILVGLPGITNTRIGTSITTNRLIISGIGISNGTINALLPLISLVLLGFILRVLLYFHHPVLLSTNTIATT